jgi:[ribosomal protein S18]-alanine N-acetyltransferase
MIDYSTLPYIVEPMQERDIEQVMIIEHEAFSAPWTSSAYRHELYNNEMAHYLVLRKPHPPVLTAPKPQRPVWRALFPNSEPSATHAPPLPPVLAYGGYWLMVDEAHISTIATARAWRSKHLGELMLVGLIEHAQDIGADLVTLEVRVGNSVAQNLYHKYGFSVRGRRKRYYTDNNEDALIMTTESIRDASYQEMFAALKEKLFERLRTEKT